jgi:hypothetical protein
LRFTVRRPPTGAVSPCSHRPSGGDVACSMDVGVAIPGDPVGRDPRGHRARQPEPHPAHLGHPHPTELAVQPLDVMRFDRDLPEPLVHTGFAPRRATVRAGEEVLHRLPEIPQRLLLHRLTRRTKPPVLGAGLGQLRTLLVVAGRVASRPPILLLLDGQVPHIPSWRQCSANAAACSAVGSSRYRDTLAT